MRNDEYRERIRTATGDGYTKRARQLRKFQTPAEAAFWNIVRGSKIRGVRFRRQVVIRPYIIDFFCSAARLVVEIDGSSHIGRDLEDAARSEWLEASPFRVIRFTNRQVLDSPSAVRMRLLHVVREQLDSEHARRSANPLPDLS